MRATLAWHAGRLRGRACPGLRSARQTRAWWPPLAGALPADVLLLCSIFGNVSDRDITRTVQAAAALCRAGATVIWTRHRSAPGLTPQIRAWFTESGFEEIAFDTLETSVLTSVGVNRLCCAPAAGLPGYRLFTFSF